MFPHAYRAHAWAAATMWDAKRFVQVQMANICSVITETTQTDLAPGATTPSQSGPETTEFR